MIDLLSKQILEDSRRCSTLLPKLDDLFIYLGFYLIYLLFYVAFNSQGHIATGSLQVEETSAYCTVNHWASASNYQLSNMKRPARDSNRRPQRLEARTLTATPPSPLYLGFYIAFNTVQVISRRVVGRAEETSTYSLFGFCTVNCRPTASNYQLSHLRPFRGSNPGLRGPKLDEQQSHK